MTDFKFIDYTELTPELSKKVFEIRNSDTIRCAMENSEKFSFCEHLLFIERLKTSALQRYWAICQDSQYIGSIYLNFIDEAQGVAEWGIFVNPCLMKKGYATEMSHHFFQYLRRTTSLKRIKAKVKKINKISLAFHQSILFEIKETRDDYYYLERKLI
jgi:UDP-4-amino-4,6-dideoxy-N-acetyl-beta-L-altrosamine N-acetyltransferase